MSRTREALRGVKQALKEDRVGLVAAGVAFYVLLALFPALAAGVSVFSLVGDPRALAARLGELRFMPASVRDLVASQLTRLAEQPGSSLGLALVLSILVALWGAGKGARAVVQALNIAHGVQEDRGLVRVTLLTLAMTFAAIVLGLAALFAAAAVPLLFDALFGNGALHKLATIGTWIVLAACAAGALTLVYRLAPARRAGRRRWLSPGALVAAPLWIAGSLLFSLYVRRFGSYQETYGSLGAMVVLLLWLWISAYVAILGAELDVELERARRSEGAEEPRARGRDLPSRRGRAGGFAS